MTHLLNVMALRADYAIPQEMYIIENYIDGLRMMIDEHKKFGKRAAEYGKLNFSRSNSIVFLDEYF